jgi:hypothetical protein
LVGAAGGSYSDWIIGQSFRDFNLYYFTPLGDSLNFYIYGGVGYYLGKLTHNCKHDYTCFTETQFLYSWDEKYDYRSSVTIKEESKQSTVGFKGGLGLEMNMGPSISLGLEVFGRFVNFNNWEGDYSRSWTSRERLWHKLYGWYFDETLSGSSSEHGNLWIHDYVSNGKDNKEMQISEYKPDWSGISNVKKSGHQPQCLRGFNLAEVPFRPISNIRVHSQAGIPAPGEDMRSTAPPGDAGRADFSADPALRVIGAPFPALGGAIYRGLRFSRFSR